MKLTYLGTAAAEGWPGVFCGCEYCRKAREKGGRNIRTRSQALVNGDLLIDFPVDAYAHALANGLRLAEVDYVLFTHAHLDHCTPTDLFYRREGSYAHDIATPSVQIFGNEAVRERFDYIGKLHHDDSFPRTFTVIQAYKTFNIGDYQVTPLRANHSYGEKAYVYLIRQGGKTLLYLHDTGPLFEDVFEYLVANRVRADLVSYDCTLGALTGGKYHMGLAANAELKEKLLALGIIDEKTVNVVNHFSHNGQLIYDEMVVEAEKRGFLTSYDGMSIEF